MISDLPPNVCAVPDRHGKIRYRFRRKGWKSAYLPGTPGDEKFHRAYADILAGGPVQHPTVKSQRKIVPYSLDDLILRMKATTRWQKKADRTRHVQSRILERFTDRKDQKGRRYGEWPVKSITVEWLDKVLSGMSETPAAANVLRKVLSSLLDAAIRLGWRTDNPARLTETYREGPGHHTWSEDEIAAFRAKHPLGTMARLTLELALNTAARRCNVAVLTRDDIVNGRIIVDHAKGNDETSVKMLPTTKAALEALPAAPIKHLVTNIYGKPFSVPGLGNRMRKWCNEAGLKNCSMHGLRKATSRRIAESGGTDAEGQAITGHRKAKTFAHYRAKANRAHLADQAFDKLAHVYDGED
ncbi:MAG: tyrosine-type recombinase/integrase [Sphingomonadales bacterium]|nr:tyrosine-type recombinase/integrase [Sphingomonadales bacterium]MDE2168646.1 tyrosine-type recombinase/integrase [Sphingomonadales bacterium]